MAQAVPRTALLSAQKVCKTRTNAHAKIDVSDSFQRNKWDDSHKKAYPYPLRCPRYVDTPWDRRAEFVFPQLTVCAARLIVTLSSGVFVVPPSDSG